VPDESPALRALLTNLVDYAGLFPPAALSLPIAAENYRRYLRSENAWMLGRFVVPTAQLSQMANSSGWRITVLSDAEVTAENLCIESLETKTLRKFFQPTYCEIPLDDTEALAAVQRLGAYAKVRTGGLTPDTIPTAAAIAGFLRACAKLRLPFKATAGLHHPVRSQHPLTYEANAPCATMHGFVNVFLAAAFAWHGADESTIVDVLSEANPAAFHFDEVARWHDEELAAEQLAEARRHFAHSFGSCSFEEPVADLCRLGWLT
jgi:hypothetical protein